MKKEEGEYIDFRTNEEKNKNNKIHYGKYLITK